MNVREKREKIEKITDLLLQVNFPPNLLQFFDLDSEKLLDEKIKVLEALKKGKNIEDITKFYDILELYPGDDQHWD